MEMNVQLNPSAAFELGKRVPATHQTGGWLSPEPVWRTSQTRNLRKPFSQIFGP